jgi:phycoerythrin-associated linker protein
MISTAPAVKFGIDAFAGAPIELWPTSSADDVQSIIRAVYRQVLGNAHVMDSERLVSAESQLANRSISVREFVRLVAKSDFYRQRFFEASAPYRFVELNFKHLLGRAPLSQEEVSAHIQTCANSGYDAEIDSYIDSPEYAEAYGDSTVPFFRGIVSQVGQKQVGYSRMFSLFRGPAESDSAVRSSKLVGAIASNSAVKITPSKGGGIGSPPDATGKRFRIVVSGQTNGGRRRLANQTYIVDGDNMTPQIQRINRTSGRIVSITEI